MEPPSSQRTPRWWRWTVEELTRLFEDSGALPQLTSFVLRDGAAVVAAATVEEETVRVYNCEPLVKALATTVVVPSGRPRPVAELAFHVPTHAEVLVPAALLPGLTGLQLSRARPGWLERWTDLAEVSTALPQLRELVVGHHKRDVRDVDEEDDRDVLDDVDDDDEDAESEDEDDGEPEEEADDGDAAPVATPWVAPATQLLPFLETMAARPLQLLCVRFDEHVTCNAAAMTQLARLDQLRELDLSAGRMGKCQWLDWSLPALFAFFTTGCLPCLRALRLGRTKLSVEAVVAIASAARQLEELTSFGSS